jgi:hypothetical protein
MKGDFNATWSSVQACVTREYAYITPTLSKNKDNTGHPELAICQYINSFFTPLHFARVGYLL